MEKKDQNELCIISFMLDILPKIFILLAIVITKILDDYSIIDNVIELVDSISYYAVDIIWILSIIGFIIMTFIRTRYPKNKLGIALMIYYIIEYSIIIVIFITTVVQCVQEIKKM